MKIAIVPAAIGMAIGLAFVAPVAGAKSPSSFIEDAIKGDNSEIKLGQLAEAKGASEGVRDYGKTLVTDHEQAKSQAAKAAQAMNVEPPTGIMPEAQQEYDKLNGMSGKAFDDEFVHYMIEDHKKDISDFKEEAESKHEQTSTLATAQLPTLQKHLQIAESLNNSHS